MFKNNFFPLHFSKQIKEAWEPKKSTITNLYNMGLAYNPNKVLKIPNSKKEIFKAMKPGDQLSPVSDSEDEKVEKKLPQKLHVAQSLEDDARHPRVRLFRLPNNEVHFVTYMMDKYGDDYEVICF